MNILITGSSGFLGKQILKELSTCSKYSVSASVRQNSKILPNKMLKVGNINRKTCWKEALNGQQVVIHCAGRAHIMNENQSTALNKYKEVNTYGTLNLAKQAAIAGVKRFIFISSIKVNGESTSNGILFNSKIKTTPKDPYGLSKYEAEQGLIKIASNTAMEVVIIRPPLIYGPGVKANFKSLLNLASKKIPLPFGLFSNNRRSLVSIYNLIDLILCCIDHPNASNEIFLVSDDNDLSTKEMIKLMAKVQKNKIFLIPVPISILKFLFKLIGKKEIISKLTESLQLDISHTKKTLNWKPPLSVHEGFKRCIL